MYVRISVLLVLLLGVSKPHRAVAQGGEWTLVRQAASDQGLTVHAAHSSGYVFVGEATTCGNAELRCWTRLQSHDAGATWERVRDSVGVAPRTANVSAFPEVLVGGPFGVFRSRDAGRSWTVIRSQIQDSYLPHQGFRTISRWGRDTLLVANSFSDSQNKSASEFWYSTDDGRSWLWSYWGQPGPFMLAALASATEPVVYYHTSFFRATSGPAPSWAFRQVWYIDGVPPTLGAVSRLVRGPRRASGPPVLYAGFGWYGPTYFPRNGPTVARSRDGGRSWAPLPAAPVNLPITDMTINARGTLAVAVEGAGVHVSDDEGESWRRVGMAAIGDSVTSLALTDDGTVYAVRNYRTLYRSRTGLVATAAAPPPGHAPSAALTVRPSVVRVGASVRLSLTGAGGSAVEDNEVEVVDAMGRVVWRGSAGGEGRGAEVATDGWAAGLYAVRLSADASGNASGASTSARVAAVRFVVVR